MIWAQNGSVTAARILVIEDSEAIRLPVFTVLDAQGFQVQGLPTEPISKAGWAASGRTW